MTAAGESDTDKTTAVDGNNVPQPERPQEAPTAEIGSADLMRIFDNLAAEFKAIAGILKSLGDKN